MFTWTTFLYFLYKIKLYRIVIYFCYIVFHSKHFSALLLSFHLFGPVCPSNCIIPFLFPLCAFFWWPCWTPELRRITFCPCFYYLFFTQPSSSFVGPYYSVTAKNLFNFNAGQHVLKWFSSCSGLAVLLKVKLWWIIAQKEHYYLLLNSLLSLSEYLASLLWVFQNIILSTNINNPVTQYSTRLCK